MNTDNSGAVSGKVAEEAGPRIVVAVFAAVAVGLQVAAWNAVFHRLHGSLDPAYFVASLFLSINLLICYWEMCLYWRRDYIEKRADYWVEQGRATGRPPAILFLTSGVPLRRIASPTVWADVWAAYSVYDGSYTDRRTYGFNADIANGFFTPIASMFLLATMTFGFLPATFAGMIALALSWQWVYLSSLYLVAYYVGQHHVTRSRGDQWLWVWVPNALWILVPLCGLWLSVRLILDGTYGVVGH